MDEYAGIIGRIKFLWRFRCVKLRIVIEIIGLLNAFAFGTLLSIYTIIQWYVPGHKLTFVWNKYNEAHIEYLWVLIALPCMLYFLHMNSNRLAERWQRS